MRWLFLVLALGNTAAYDAGWRNGNVGVGRRGNVFRSESFAGAGACFDECMKDERCEFWNFDLHSSEKGTCNLLSDLHTSEQYRAQNTTTSSGVKVAAKNGLLPKKFKPVKLGSIKPEGWLQTQLKLMANGQAGHLELFWLDVMDSVWVGGHSDNSGAGHERGPYWLNGVVPLSAHLNASGDNVSTTLDVDLQGQVNRWIYYLLDHQNASGWLGPDDGFGGTGNTYWTGWNAAASLLQYAQAHSDGEFAAVGERCNYAVLRYIEQVYLRMLDVPTTSWSQNRWQDWVYIIQWLMDEAPQGHEQMLWDAALLAQQQSWDWDAYYDRTGVGRTGAYVGKSIPKFATANVPAWTMWDHGVNNAMGTKSCAVWYRMTRNQTDVNRTYHKLQVQDEYQGQPHGMFSGDECFGGRALNRGIELCAVVEQMYSLYANFHILGDPVFLDRAERIAYNALPGTIDPVMWRHQYLQQANEINARYALNEHPWQTDGADSTGFGVAPNFGCCTANFVQGWAKFASNVVVESVDDGGLLIAMLAPVEVRLRDITVTVDTEYPFEDNVLITVDALKLNGSFPLHVRVPAWATDATIQVGGGLGGSPYTIDRDSLSDSPINGTFQRINCAAGAKTVIQVQLHPQIRLERSWGLPPQALPSAVEYSGRGAVVPSANASASAGASAGASAIASASANAYARARAEAKEVKEGVKEGDDRSHSHRHHVHIHEQAAKYMPPADEDGRFTGGDWTFSGGAGVTKSSLPGAIDLNSGSPNHNTTAILNHPIYGEGHRLHSISLSYRYTIPGKAPFPSFPGKKQLGSGSIEASTFMQINVLFAANQSKIATIYQSPPLTSYSNGSYSPPIAVHADQLQIANVEPLMLSLEFINRDSNLQLALPNVTGLDVMLMWEQNTTKGPSPPRPFPGNVRPQTAAVAVLRGPLLYSLHLEQVESVVRTWKPFENTDVNLDLAGNSAPWNVALVLDHDHPLSFIPSEAGLNQALPFNISGFFGTIQATARRLPGWGVVKNAADEPPPSPVDCGTVQGGCGEEIAVTLVPYGMTNLRMAGLPWIGAMSHAGSVNHPPQS